MAYRHESYADKVLIGINRAIYSDSIYLALWTALFYLIYHTTSYLWKYYILALGGFIMVMVSYEDI